ncbi:integrase catalytic domain-containing protein [Nephila pilipes]|uniref:Integrase catalytic domain-containing protein n=1 Tax=Nephila pilipes TaxID=299642 RepID=A0A8X6PMW1_NEPPI|nr:integrase catalytic domain-containing protein [Nephila pilipes]
MGPNRITRLTRCLSDGGNQYSFVSSDLVSSLKLPVISTRSLELEVFESPSSFSQTRRQVRFQLSSIWDNLKNVVNSEPPVKVSDSLTLITSIFGCILSGPRSHATVSFIPIVHNINVDTSIQELDDVVREFLILESIDVQPIQEEKRNICNSELLTNFHQSFEIIDGRRVVKLPWKPEVQLSSNHYEVALIL